MGLLWSRPPPDDYERILSDLTAKVGELETELGEVRQNERRWSVKILSYGSFIYILTALYIFLYPRGAPLVVYRPLLDALALLLGPFAVYYTRRITFWLYNRRLTALEVRLRTLRAKQKLKVEELKQITSYYKTKGLIERFDVNDEVNLNLNDDDDDQHHHKQFKKTIGKIPITSASTKCFPQNGISRAASTPPSIIVPNSNNHPPPPSILASVNAPPLPPLLLPPSSPCIEPSSVTPQTWLDRLVDAIIGDDKSMMKYALVCQKCFSHNGLIRPEEFDTIQYICPNCHHMNLPRKAPPPPQLNTISPFDSAVVTTKELETFNGTLSPLSSTTKVDESLGFQNEPTTDPLEQQQQQEEPAIVTTTPRQSSSSGKKSLRLRRRPPPSSQNSEQINGDGVAIN